LRLRQASPAVIKFAPPAPNAAEPIVVTVDVTTDDRPTGAVATVQNNVIGITLSATLLGFTAPPRTGVTTSMGPLAAGTYQVNLFGND
jgi:hypothetical protein